MDEKLNKKVVVISVIAVVALVIGISLAIFIVRRTGNEHAFTSANLTLNFGDGSAIIRNTGIEPIYEDEVKSLATTKEFTIQNTSNKTLYVTLSLEEITAQSELKSELFHWDLYETTSGSETLVDSGNFNVGSETTLDMINDITFNANQTKNYKLYVWLEETLEDQNALQGLSFSSRIVAKGYLKQVEVSPNEPVLASGMIPVVYDETSGNWEVADTNSEWYNYDEQWWANAVTVSDTSLRSAPSGTEIPMEDINSMWVWIPRYKYRIPSDIGTGTLSNPITEPPEIDVVFESGTETTGESLADCSIESTTCYYTHPAFRNGTVNKKSTNYDQGGWDEELTGIWVGKFETGTEGDTCSSSPSTTNCQNVTPKIKPDIRSLRYQTVYNQFVTSLKFAGGTLSGSTVTFAGNSTYGLTSSTDTHMMKNTEWGAVAYLSQSKYGKMGNPNYSGANKEIYINNSSNNYGIYTGRSGGGPGGNTPVNGTYSDQTSTTQYSYYGFYTYDDYLLNYNTNTKGEKVVGKGTGASTTGTIYGIYDMSGGAYDRTMGNWAGTIGSSGFTTSNLPGGSNGSKYYEKYTGTSSISITSDKSIKGDATYETKSWYSDYAYFPFASAPWSVRGGYYSNASSAGAFNSGNSNGTSNSVYGFRVALIP